MKEQESKPIPLKEQISFEDFKKEVVSDYKLAVESREASLLGRKEVLTGKAKFGIFGDGKEIPQLAMSKVFQEGDVRSGYYRDQTFMFSAGMANIEQFFAQLYANPDINEDPFSAGRQMNAHFATRTLEDDGSWKDLTQLKNSSADTSPTASQMGRSLGLALASKLYRHLDKKGDHGTFSKNGNEVVFATIGDASVAEGIFWEVLNGSGVLQVPLAIFIWDDGYGISVPIEYQITKADISTILEGFRVNENGKGIDLYQVNAWDYPGLCDAYMKGIAKVRETHIPAVFHIREATQPQGHSTSGSHERYKSKERLEWEKEFDCIRKMREWMIASTIADGPMLDKIEEEAKEFVRTCKENAWSSFQQPIIDERNELLSILDEVNTESKHSTSIKKLKEGLSHLSSPLRKDNMIYAKKTLRVLKGEDIPAGKKLIDWKNKTSQKNISLFDSHLHSNSADSALQVSEIKPIYGDDSPMVNGFEVLNGCFDMALQRDPSIVAFGEDVGKIGDVNQAFRDLQEKYGEHRVFDTGLRELSIMGQGIGLAMRGFRPIAEIQYLDYMAYGLQPLADDLSTLHYRTKGGQKAPLIIRTRGHRLEGIWHSGSPMSMILGALRGVYVIVPRNMTQAAGFYNTMLRSDEPALIIECLNGYRLKEKMPTNIGELTVPLGVPEIIREGTDVTIVTYGSCCRIAMGAAQELANMDISCEIIDVQTLLPFDIHHYISESLKKTSKVVFLDEDVPGGAVAFMMQKVLEEQEGYYFLDAKPVTVSAKEHRPAFGTDGDYFSKSNIEDVFEAVYTMMNEQDPGRFPLLY